MKSTVSIIAATVVLFASGCAAKPSIVGSWQAGSASGSGNQSFSGSSLLVFGPNGAVTSTTHSSYGPIATTDSESGSYTVAGNIVTINYTNRTLGLDPSTQTAVMQRMQQLHPGLGMSTTVQPPRNVPVDHKPVQYTWSLKGQNTLDLSTVSPNPAESQLTEFTRVAGQ